MSGTGQRGVDLPVFATAMECTHWCECPFTDPTNFEVRGMLATQ